ncbi:ABC transporter substrate-binding protein [Methylobacterium nonmethylotrophicum]|uniref:ABC transporter substrate-binding protein n=1 Tax=Methylobacterium nonmethylotrophicum TaxID=1141884 RepID=A0A4Z0NHR6_9HYPH|nr:ABC transporter substrate-binding protein [Methylobacterium nonmethylotrophicum]TGD95318.1 ABC transporter substrate-binding protein [Methylobacterium nonmethylotrophicum]
MKTRITATLALMIMGAPAALAQAVPAGYPASYSEVIDAAHKEGALSIYATADASEVSDLLTQFRALYPKLKVEYADQNSTELYSRYVAEAAAGSTADFIWSSAMDLQIKLVNDGYAMTYASPEKGALPDWAKWKDQAYGTTAEPIVFAYNNRLVPEAEVPRDHAAFAKLLSQKKDAYKGKVTSYDPERSGVGFLYVTQDVQVSAPATWETVKAMGQAGAKFYTSTGAMMERVVSGEHTLAYNMIGSYVLQRNRKDPTLGYVLPKDYTLVMSRIAFVSAKAKNPNAAKLFLDFMLSKAAQVELAKKSMTSVRTDLQDTHGITSLPGARDVTLRPIRVGPELLTQLDQITRLRFIKQWQKTLAATN